MPASDKRKEERKTLSRAQAWKDGLVGGKAWKWKAGLGRGRGRGDGGGRGGGRGGRFGGGGHHHEGSADDDRWTQEDIEPTGGAGDESDSDPLAKLGARDPHEALMASLRGDHGDAFAATSSDESDDDEPESDDEPDADPASDGDGDAGADATLADAHTDDEGDTIEGIVDEHGNPVEMDEDVDLSDDGEDGEDGEESHSESDGDTAGDSDGIPDADPPSDDEAPASEGDDEDEVQSDDEMEGKLGASSNGGSIGGINQAHPHGLGADHTLARHLRRTVDQDAADAIALTAPKYKPVTGTRGKDTGGKKDARRDRGRWEADKTALNDARDGETIPVLHSSPPDVPLGLPAKLKERWNALYDPTGTAALNKKYKKALGAKGQSKDPKVEEAKAKRAEAVAAAPAAPFKSALQSELFALMDTYKDVTYTARTPPGTTRKEPVNSDGSGGGGDEVMDAYLLHVMNHVMRTR